MKKFLTVLTSLIAVALCGVAVACESKNPDPGLITVTENEYNGATLSEYMDYLQGEGELTYSISGGMVTEINGTANTTNSFWMLYTDDGENSDESWGTYEYENVTYASASLGAETLPVKVNCTYIWVYQTF